MIVNLLTIGIGLVVPFTALTIPSMTGIMIARLITHNIMVSQTGVTYAVAQPHTTERGTFITADSIMLIIEYAIATMPIIVPWFVWNLTKGDFLCAPAISGTKKRM